MANLIQTTILSSDVDGADHVMITVPCYGVMDPQVMISIVSNVGVLTANNVNVSVLTKVGDCDVNDVRNDIARVFLESKATHLMSWDADVVASGQCVKRLLDYGKDIVAAVYPFKSEVEGYPVVFEDGTFELADQGLIKVAGVPGGFTLWSRRAIQSLYDAEGSEKEWQNKGDYGKLKVRAIWERTVNTERGLRVSSDIVACQKATQLGMDIFVSPEMPLGHIGSKQYFGQLGHYLMEKSGGNAGMAKVAFTTLQRKDPYEEPDAVFEACQQLAAAFWNKSWAVDEGMLAVLFELADRPDINSVLETGSGLSTAAFLAAGLEIVTALEAEPIWGAKTEEFLRYCGIDVATKNPVRYAPLKSIPGEGKWYDFETDYRYDMVLIDGPRREEVDQRARLLDRLPNLVKRAKVVVLDDVDDIDGQRLVERVEAFGFKATKLVNLRNREFAICEKVEDDDKNGDDNGDGERPKAD